jgi:L-ascorbate metabolism protein UlaG (beta-lactamase superfamily)
MKITKFPQSCIVIENNNQRLIIDPGSLVSPKFKAESLLPIDAILITHEHQDHADPLLIESLLNNKKVPVIANDSAQAVLGDLVTKIVKDNEIFEIGSFRITCRELPHVDMIDGSKGPKNTGYIVNDIFFHPGDGIEISNLQVNSAAVPIAGPDISPKDIFGFIKEIGARTVIPIHYDYFKADPVFYEDMFKNRGLETKFVILNNGQSCEI